MKPTRRPSRKRRPVELLARGTAAPKVLIVGCPAVIRILAIFGETGMGK
jgi:hypothetical protein